MRFMNSGVNLRRAASIPLFDILALSFLIADVASALPTPAAPESQFRKSAMPSRRAEIAGHEDHGAGEIDFAVVAQRQGRFVQDAEQQIPQRVAGFLDFIEQDEADLDVVGVMLVDHFLAEQRMRFAMPQISGRRTDQFGNFVAVLKFGAIDFYDGARVPN